jgi:hypothetical protein
MLGTRLRRRGGEMINISMEVDIPFYLPVKTTQSWLKINPPNTAIKYSFFDRNICILENGKGSQFKTLSRVLVEAKFQKDSFSFTSEDDHEFLRCFVVFVIKNINEFAESFRKVYQYANVRKFSVLDLPAVIGINIDGSVIGYITNPHEILDKVSLKDEKVSIDKVTKYLATSDKYPKQTLHDRFFEWAKGEIWNENYIEAITLLQTSFEVFIYNSLRLVLSNEDYEAQKIEKKMFLRRLKDNLLPTLGIQWDESNAECVKIVDVFFDIIHATSWFTGLRTSAV